MCMLMALIMFFMLMTIYIPLGAVHSLANESRAPHLVEVQSGSYLGEDDIESGDIYAQLILRDIFKLNQTSHSIIGREITKT